MLTTDITNQSDYKQIKVIIKSELESLASGFVSLGFYLKKVRDEELYKEGGYRDIFEFAQKEYNLSRSVTSRWISINDKFSVGGNSPEIDTEYRNYGSSLLSEMLTLPEENYVLVTENTTVAQIREMKKEFTEDDSIPGQLEITNSPEYMPENADCDVAQDILTIFVKWYFANEGKQVFEQVLKILRRGEPIESAAEQIMYKIAPSKYKVFKMSVEGVVANIVCKETGIAILKLGARLEQFSYADFIHRFESLFGLSGTPEDIYRKYYNVELKEPEKVEKPKEEPKKEIKEKETPKKQDKPFINPPETVEKPENSEEETEDDITEIEEEEVIEDDPEEENTEEEVWEENNETEEVEIVEAEIVEPAKEEYEVIFRKTLEAKMTLLAKSREEAEQIAAGLKEFEIESCQEGDPEWKVILTKRG